MEQETRKSVRHEVVVKGALAPIFFCFYSIEIFEISKHQTFELILTSAFISCSLLWTEFIAYCVVYLLKSTLKHKNS